jgi:adenylylsulfate kinase
MKKIIHIFGMSNTGKSTLGKSLLQRLNNLSVELIDADDYRKTLNSDLGFSKEDRIENVRRLQELANKSKSDIVILCAVSPYAEMRSKDNINIFLTSSTETLIERDIEKQIYKNINVAGVDSPFELPNEIPYLQLNTETQDLETCIKSIMDYANIKLKYAMFVGRWQTLHEGHKWLFNQKLETGENILICVRDVASDNSNPLSAEQVKVNIENEYQELVKLGRVKVMIIPDISSINYGRGVGYEVVEHFPPSEIKSISGTAIRNKQNNL